MTKRFKVAPILTRQQISELSALAHEYEAEGREKDADDICVLFEVAERVIDNLNIRKWAKRD